MMKFSIPDHLKSEKTPTSSITESYDIDNFESQLENPVNPKNGNIGNLRWSGDQKYPGFALTFDGHPTHMACFIKD